MSDLESAPQGFIFSNLLIQHFDLINQRIECFIFKRFLVKVVTSGTLFSKPEQDYLDYMLNMHKYSNGLDLRNRYCHGNNPIDEKVSESNYYQILKIMCLIIIKINDEFCKYC